MTKCRMVMAVMGMGMGMVRMETVYITVPLSTLHMLSRAKNITHACTTMTKCNVKDTEYFQKHKAHPLNVLTLFVCSVRV